MNIQRVSCMYVRVILTFADHANSKTLLEPAELTSIAMTFVNDTRSVRQTHVLGTFLDGSL